MRYIVTFLFYTVIPCLTAYLSSSSFLYGILIKYNILSKEFNIAQAQDVFLIISVFFTTFVVGIKIVRNEYKSSQHDKQVAGLYNMIKEICTSSLKEVSKSSTVDFNMRIFVPLITPKYLVHKFYKRNKFEFYFVIRNITPFAKSDQTELLRFRVYPRPQGIVGECYRSKKIVYDDNLQSTNETNWNLNRAQIARTNDLLWCICIPIIDHDNDNVVAVVSLDSNTSKIEISSHRQELSLLLNTYSFLLYDSVPDLFKERWCLK